MISFSKSTFPYAMLVTFCLKFFYFYIFCMVYDKKIKCHLKCQHLGTSVVEKCSPVMKLENLKKLNLQIMVLYNFIYLGKDPDPVKI